MKTLTNLLTTLRALLCSYICKPDEPDEHADIEERGIIVTKLGDEDE